MLWVFIYGTRTYISIVNFFITNLTLQNLSRRPVRYRYMIRLFIARFYGKYLCWFFFLVAWVLWLTDLSKITDCLHNVTDNCDSIVKWRPSSSTSNGKKILQLILGGINFSFSLFPTFRCRKGFKRPTQRRLKRFCETVSLDELWKKTSSTRTPPLTT